MGLGGGCAVSARPWGAGFGGEPARQRPLPSPSGGPAEPLGGAGRADGRGPGSGRAGGERRRRCRCARAGPAAGFPRRSRSPSLMERGRRKAGGRPEERRKRRRASHQLVGAAEARRAGRGREDRPPEAKKARLSTILFAENCEVTYDQLRELLKYAVLGKSSAPKPSWCQLFHQNHLNGVVVFVLQGMSQLHFYRFYLEFGSLRKAFRHPLLTTSQDWAP